MNKKILVITDNLTTQVNGVVTTYNNIKIQAKRNGYDVEFIDPSMFRHFNCPGYPEVKLCFPFNIGEKIQNANPDHVHIATEGPIGLAAKLWLDRQGWQYNTSYHTKWPEFLKKIYKFPKSISYTYLQWFHKKSHCVMTTTETMVNDLSKREFNKNIVSWTRGIDRSRLVPTVSHTKTDNKIRVLYVGRVSKEKGLDDLCKLHEHFDITVVGDGPARSGLESQYPSVQFVGYKKDSELANFYISADVFAFPSCVDTFGIVMIESISLGTPVAAYPVTGPIDVVQNRLNGYLHHNLKFAIEESSKLNRNTVAKSADTWSWEKCWDIFQSHLTTVE